MMERCNDSARTIMPDVGRPQHSLAASERARHAGADQDASERVASLSSVTSPARSSSRHRPRLGRSNTSASRTDHRRGRRRHLAHRLPGDLGTSVEDTGDALPVWDALMRMAAVRHHAAACWRSTLPASRPDSSCSTSIRLRSKGLIPGSCHRRSSWRCRDRVDRQATVNGKEASLARKPTVLVGVDGARDRLATPSVSMRTWDSRHGFPPPPPA